MANARSVYHAERVIEEVIESRRKVVDCYVGSRLADFVHFARFAVCSCFNRLFTFRVEQSLEKPYVPVPILVRIPPSADTAYAQANPHARYIPDYY